MRMRHTPIVNIGIESTAYQRALAQTAFLAGLPVSEIRASGSKLIRMHGMSASIENGRIMFPDPAVRRDSWFDGFKMEYLAFPYGEHDDQLDSLYMLFKLQICRRKNLLSTSGHENGESHLALVMKVELNTFVRETGWEGGALSAFCLDSNYNSMLGKTAMEKASFVFYSKKRGYSAI
jgi:predicted phage terminase large subunit-like protein